MRCIKPSACLLIFALSTNLFAFTKNKYPENPCNFDFDKYLKDTKTSNLAKRLFNDEYINIDTDDPLFLLDSLTAEDKQARPFYFKVAGNSYKSSDGYYSEGLGSIGKKYVLENTIEFISYFDNKSCFTGRELETWADIVMLELSLEADNNENNKSLVDDYNRKLFFNCKHCSATQKETLDTFSKLLTSKWKSYLKSINK